MKVAAVLALALNAVPVTVAVAEPSAAPPASSPEMVRIFDQDQADRKTPTIDWKVVSVADGARRAATQVLLAEGRLHTAEDFRDAAFVFQHGDKPADFLLAHTLAMIAVAKGDAQSLWIATATLDRYLQSMEQKQIFGTQYRHPKDRPWTQEPYDRALISDALRNELGVPPQADQAKKVEQLNGPK